MAVHFVLHSVQSIDVPRIAGLRSANDIRQIPPRWSAALPVSPRFHFNQWHLPLHGLLHEKLTWCAITKPINKHSVITVMDWSPRLHAFHPRKTQMVSETIPISKIAGHYRRVSCFFVTCRSQKNIFYKTDRRHQKTHVGESVFFHWFHMKPMVIIHSRNNDMAWQEAY